jgi:PAS domain S-box-containing protein
VVDVIAAASFSRLEAIVSDLPVTFVLVVSAVVLTALLTFAVVIALSRRRRKDAQEIVLLLEEMRSGRVRARLDLDPRSPFAPIAESANRLGQDLGVRWSRAETASEGFYALQEAARGYAVIATDADGDLRAFSPGAAQIFGWEEDAVVGRNASLLFDPASWKELLPKLARKSLRERGVETRALMARQDGKRFEARLIVRVLRGHGDEPSGFLLVVQDVTEQVHVETGLRAAESRSRGILEDLPAGVALIQGGRIVSANPTMRALLELPEMQVAGLALRERIATSHILLVQDALARLEAGVGDATFEATVTLLDAAGQAGREVRFVGVAHAHEGRPAVLVLLRDETAERRLVRTLAAEEARLSAVLDAWDDAVLLVEEDASGSRVRLANRAFVSLFSLTRAEVSGATEGDLLRALRDRGEEGIAAAACLAASSGGPANDLVATVARSLSLWAAPLADSRGRRRGRMLAARDVSTQQTALRAQADEVAQWRRDHETAVASYATMRALRDEIEARRQVAEELNAELRTLDGMKSDLLANVSHELQTPLVSIRGYTEMILKGRLGTINDEQRKGLSLSLKNIDRLIAMIDNLLAFARMDRESGAMKISSFPLAGVVDEALALLADRIEAKTLRVTRGVDDPALMVRADRDKVLQVFLNLLGNAVKFNRERGAIEVSARRGKPGFALVQVRDTGAGIAKEDLEKVFDRFYQAGDGAKQVKEGTGIGLAIVRNILRLHGCVVHATSEVGEGTTLSFTLPLAGERVEAQDAPSPSGPPADPPRDAPASRGEPESLAEPATRGGAERPRLRIIRRG